MLQCVRRQWAGSVGQDTGRLRGMPEGNQRSLSGRVELKSQPLLADQLPLRMGSVPWSARITSAETSSSDCPPRPAIVRANESTRCKLSALSAFLSKSRRLHFSHELKRRRQNMTKRDTFIVCAILAVLAIVLFVGAWVVYFG